MWNAKRGARKWSQYSGAFESVRVNVPRHGQSGSIRKPGDQMDEEFRCGAHRDVLLPGYANDPAVR